MLFLLLLVILIYKASPDPGESGQGFFGLNRTSLGFRSYSLPIPPSDPGPTIRVSLSLPAPPAPFIVIFIHHKVFSQKLCSFRFFSALGIFFSEARPSIFFFLYFSALMSLQLLSMEYSRVFPPSRVFLRAQFAPAPADWKKSLRETCPLLPPLSV